MNKIPVDIITINHDIRKAEKADRGIEIRDRKFHRLFDEKNEVHIYDYVDIKMNF